MLDTYTLPSGRLRTFTEFASEPHRMAIKLHSVAKTPQVYWSEQGNSYVVARSEHGYYTAPDGSPCDLISINGHGEIRWVVSSDTGNTSGDTDAATYFGLTWHGWRSATDARD